MRAAYARSRGTLALVSGLMLLLLYAIITFPSAEWLSSGGRIASGIDASWMWGLNLFGNRSFLYGRDVIFTYGPLGYLLVPLDIKNHIAQSLTLYATVQVVIVALGCFFLIRTRRIVPLLLFVLGYYVLAVCNPEPDQRLVAVLLIAAALAGEFRSRALAYCCFAFAAPLLLMKFTAGIAGAAIVLALGLHWRWKHRSWEVLLLGGGLYVLSMFVCTCLFLGGPGGFPRFWRLSTEIATGYNGAMFHGGPDSEILLGIGALALLLGGLFWFRLRNSRFTGLLILIAIPSFLAFKNTFVRHDVGHLTFLFHMTLVGLSIALLFSWNIIQCAWSVSAYVLVLSVYLSLIGGYRQDAAQRLLDPITGRTVRKAWDTVFHLDRELSRFRLVTERGFWRDHLSRELLSSLRGDSAVMVLPWEIALCVVNHLPCIPYPTLQMYVTYTTALDQGTADKIRSYRNLHILAEVESFEGRQSLWDCPITWQAILEGWKVDRVAEGLAGRRFVLLKQRDDALRIAELPTGEASARFGEWIPVPNRSPWLRAHLDLRERWTGWMRRLLFRPRLTILEIRRASGAVESFRLVVDTARDGIWIASAPRAADDLVQWFEGAVSADPVIAMRVSGPSEPDLESNYHIHWSTSVTVDR